MSTTIEALQQIVNNENRTTEERREAAEHILKLQGQRREIDAEAAAIPDDDPEVLELVKPHPNPQIEKLIGNFCIRTLPEAKLRIAWERRKARLKATVADESLSMAERVRAADQWRSD